MIMIKYYSSPVLGAWFAGPDSLWLVPLSPFPPQPEAHQNLYSEYSKPFRPPTSRHEDTDSTPKRTPIPRKSGHPEELLVLLFAKTNLPEIVFFQGFF
jgi:hypothetical protein